MNRAGIKTEIELGENRIKLWMRTGGSKVEDGMKLGENG